MDEKNRGDGRRHEKKRETQEELRRENAAWMR